MGEPEGQRVGPGGMGQFVHERFPHEGIGRGRQARFEPWRSGELLPMDRLAFWGTSYGVSMADPPELIFVWSQAISEPLASKPPRISISPAGRK